jgi:hypothetical protein
LGSDLPETALELEKEAERVVGRLYQPSPTEAVEQILKSKAREIEEKIAANRRVIEAKLKLCDAAGRKRVEESVLSFLSIYENCKVIHEIAERAGVETVPFTESPPNPNEIREPSLTIHQQYMNALRRLSRTIDRSVRRFRWRVWGRHWTPRLIYLTLALLLFWLLDSVKELVPLKLLAVAIIWAVHESLHPAAHRWLERHWRSDLEDSVRDLYGVLIWLTYFVPFLDHELARADNR